MMLPGGQPGKRALAQLLLTISIILLLLLHWYQPPTAGLWSQTIFESLHVPVFGFIAISLYIATGTRTKFSFTEHAVIVSVIAFALGLLSEATQIPGPRDASVKGLVSDWLGAAARLLLALAFGVRVPVSRTTQITFAVVGAAVLVTALWPPITVSIAYIERNIQRPVLVSFDARFGQEFRRTQHTTLQVISDSTGTRKVGQISLQDGAWPGLIFHDISPDWRGYSSLVLEFGLDDDRPLDIHVRVHDRKHKQGSQPYNDRFNMNYTLPPGRHQLRVPLEKIRDAPHDRRMDLSEIDGIVIFCSPTAAGRSFQLAEVRLE